MLAKKPAISCMGSGAECSNVQVISCTRMDRLNLLPRRASDIEPCPSPQATDNLSRSVFSPRNVSLAEGRGDFIAVTVQGVVHDFRSSPSPWAG
jgi:hypothetical protein